MTSPYAPPTDVIGDGTTARSRLTARGRRARLPLTVLAVVVATAGLAAIIEPRTSAVPLGPDNPSETGARALAEVLRDRGVDVEYVRTTAAAVDAAGAGSTLLVTSTDLLYGEQIEALIDSPADLVLLGPDPFSLEQLTDDLLSPASSPGGAELREAACADPDAVAAQQVTVDSGAGVAPGPEATPDSVVVCFPAQPGGDESFAYAVAEVDGRRVTVLSDRGSLTNARVADEGNAALALRVLGERERLVWYVPSFDDLGTDPLVQGPTGPGLDDLLPPAAGPIAVQLALVVLALALWRGRALGRTVTEPLPVTVRSSESTLGRGLLYRRARAHGHAAAGLRAAAARRAAARLGLPRNAGAPEVVDALARATGRSTQQVGHLLYGPPPTDDAGLLHLARQLDELESEVHRT